MYKLRFSFMRLYNLFYSMMLSRRELTRILYFVALLVGYQLVERLLDLRSAAECQTIRGAALFRISTTMNIPGVPK